MRLDYIDDSNKYSPKKYNDVNPGAQGCIDAWLQKHGPLKKQGRTTGQDWAGCQGDRQIGRQTGRQADKHKETGILQGIELPPCSLSLSYLICLLLEHKEKEREKEREKEAAALSANFNSSLHIKSSGSSPPRSSDGNGHSQAGSSSSTHSSSTVVPGSSSPSSSVQTLPNGAGSSSKTEGGAAKTGLLIIRVVEARGLTLPPGSTNPPFVPKQQPQSSTNSNRESLQRKWWLPYAVLEFDKNEVLIDALGGELSNPVWQYRAHL